MKIIVFGAGAIGSVYAAKLSRHHDVTVIARRAHVDAIDCDGLRITGREEFVAHVRARTAIDAIAPETLALLTTRVHDNRAAAVAIVDRGRPGTLVLSGQNRWRSREIV